MGTLLMYLLLYNENVTRTAGTYTVGVQREEPWVFKSLPVFISG